MFCQVAAAVLLLAIVAWRFDPPLRSNLIEGSVTAWQRSDAPSPPSANPPRKWLFVKTEVGRTVGVASARRGQPTEGGCSCKRGLVSLARESSTRNPLPGYVPC